MTNINTRPLPLQRPQTYPNRLTPAARAAGALITMLDTPGSVLDVSGTTPSPVEVPSNTATPLPIGTIIQVRQVGTGAVVFFGSPGVTIRCRYGTSVKTAGQWAVATLVKRDLNEWVLSGDLAAYTFAIADFGADAVFDAATITSPPADGAALASWTETISGAHAVQATGANQPIYRTTAGGGLTLPNAQPLVQFDGVNDYMDSTASASGAQTMFVVSRLVGTGNSSWIGSTAAGGFNLSLIGGNFVQFSGDQGATTASVNNGPGTTAWHIHAASYQNPGTAIISVDGSATSATSANTLTAAKVLRLGNRSLLDRPLNGGIAQIIHIPRALTSPERRYIESVLAARFGITVV